MNSHDVKIKLMPVFSECDITVDGEGNKYSVLIVGDVFCDLNAVKRQQRVYACINDDIASGAIHAVSMKLYTRAEWEKAKLFHPVSH